MALKNRRVFELRLGKLGLTLFVGGMSVLLFSLFLMGVFVGKHMEAYPERYANLLPGIVRESLLSADPQAGSVAVPPSAGREGGEDLAGGAEAGAVVSAPDPVAAGKAEAEQGQAAAGKEGSPAGDPAKVAAAEGPAAPAPPAPMSGRVAANQPSSASGKANGGAGKAPAAVEARPAADPQAQGGGAGDRTQPGKGRFEVQAAAYRERPQAERLVKKMAALGYTSQIVRKEIPGKGQWFRVIVGGFESRPKAQEAADQLSAKVDGLRCVIRAANGNGG
jgi:cell division septation protein DedD